MSENQENNIIELVDENGETVQFEHLATLEHEGEVVIMKIAKDDGGEECYEYVEDEDLQEAVFEKFLQLMQEQETFVEEEDED